MNENNDKENVDVEKTYNVKFNKSLISVLIVIIVVLLATIGVTLGFGVRIDIWTHFMRGCIMKLCTPI